MRKLTVQEFNKLFKPEYKVVVKSLSIEGKPPQNYLVLERTIGNIVSNEIRILCSEDTDTSLVPDIFLRKMFNR